MKDCARIRGDEAPAESGIRNGRELCFNERNVSVWTPPSRGTPLKGSLAAPSSAQAVPLFPILSEKAAVYRRAEKILIAYFAYTAVMLSMRSDPASRHLIAWIIPFLLVTGLSLESRYSAP